jgi:hypothetical protein
LSIGEGSLGRINEGDMEWKSHRSLKFHGLEDSEAEKTPGEKAMWVSALSMGLNNAWET